MQRTTISLPEDLHRQIRVLAAERGQSMAQLLRQWAEEKLAEGRPRRMPRSIGVGASGYTDTAQLAGEIQFEPPPWRSS